MDFKEVNQKRYSVRNFLNKEVKNEILTKITEQAQRAPSWANAQPWKVYFAKNETLENIRRNYQNNDAQGMRGESDFFVAHRNEWSSFAQQNMARWNTEFSYFLINNKLDFSKAATNLFNAPVVAFLTIGEMNPWSIYDLGAFGENLMLAATDAGLASLPAYEFVRYPEVLRKNLPIPDTEIIGMGIGLGYLGDQQINDFHSSRVNVDKMMKISE